jgi:peptide/nickel transport system ATP-binding protein
MTEHKADIALEVQHLTKRFPVGGLFSQAQVHAVEDVSFKIKRGEVLSLVGESGSGKSTIARLVVRLMAPTAGKILLKGQNVLETEPRRVSLQYRSQVQMIFQDPFGSLSAVHKIRHHLVRPLKIHKKARSRREVQAQVHELLETVGLNPPEEFAGKYPHELSGGQRQRVAIASALAVAPEIILADEPISMLDVSIRMGVLNLMERLKEEHQLSYLYITHDIASARYIGDRTIVMYAGHFMEGADSRELMEHPANPYTQLLLSAVPNPHLGLNKQKIAMRGEVPSLIEPPPGCPFAARCPHVMDICRQAMPGVTHIASNHWVRCYLHGAEPADPAV